MLQLPRCRRDATQPTPYREGRLLCFAGGTNPPADPNLPPEPEQTEGEGAEIERAEKKAVDQEQQATRNKASDALNPDANDGGEDTLTPHGGGTKSAKETKEKPLSSPDVIALKAKSVDSTMSDILQLLRKPAVKEEIKKLSSEDQKELWYMIDTFDEKREQTAIYSHLAEKFARWDKGNLSPSEYIDFIENYYRESPDRQRIVAELREYVQRHPEYFAEPWKMTNESTRITVIHDMNKIANRDAITRSMQEKIEAWEEQLNMLHKGLKDAETALEEKRKQNGTDMGPFRPGDLLQGLGITFHSPLEIWEAFKMVKDAYTDVLTERVRQKATLLASQFGTTLEGIHAPFGREVALKTNQKADSEDNKKKNEFKESIETESFEGLVGTADEIANNQVGGVLGKVLRANDRPAALAVMEVLASHGWIYEFGKISSVDWPITIFGVPFESLMPERWDENRQRNYLSSLRGQNSSGANKEKSNGEGIVDKAGDPKEYVIALRQELDNHNYWSAIGVAKSMFGRGKLGNASSIVFVSFVRQIRKDPVARRFFNLDILDQAGVIKWDSANFADNLLTMEKDGILKLGANPSDTENAGDSVRTVSIIERKIIAADPSLGDAKKQHELDDLVATVMSAETVKVNGKNISIFEDDFMNYRTVTMKKVFGWYTENVAQKTQADYMKQTNEALLADEKFFRQLYETGSTGSLELGDRAQFFSGVLVERLLQLKEQYGENAGPVRNFRSETGAKIKTGLIHAMTRSAPDQLPKYNIKYMDTEKTETPLIATLIHHGFITLEDLPPEPPTFRQAIAKQLAAIGGSIEPDEDPPESPGRALPDPPPHSHPRGHTGGTGRSHGGRGGGGQRGGGRGGSGQRGGGNR